MIEEMSRPFCFMIEEAKRSIQSILGSAKNPVIAWSGGRDSTLLLHLTRQIKADIPVVWFKQNISEEWQTWCESIIMEWDLTVFTYPASDTYFLPNDQGLTLVDEYSFGSAMMPVLTDVKSHYNGKCGMAARECAVNVSRERIPAFPYAWTETLTGYRNTDHHFILGQQFFPEDGSLCGNTKLYAPLRTWTDEDVLRISREIGMPEPIPDERLYRCTNCLQGTGKVFCPEANKKIDSIKWSPKARLNEFRRRFLPASSEVFTTRGSRPLEVQI